jgi:hypothetical protein
MSQLGCAASLPPMAVRSSIAKKFKTERSGIAERFKEVKQANMQKQKLEQKAAEEEHAKIMAVSKEIGKEVGFLIPQAMRDIGAFGPRPEVAPREPKAPTAIQDGSMTLTPLFGKWIPLMKDEKNFGIYYNTDQKGYVMGNCGVIFDNRNIITLTPPNGPSVEFKATEGLLELLTSKQPENHTDEDLKEYGKMLEITEAYFKNNTRSTGKPRSSPNNAKYIGIVKDIFWNKEGRGLAGSQTPSSPCPAGWAVYSEAPIEYRYVTDFGELQKRLIFINAEEQAGNNNFHNEKSAIADFIKTAIDAITVGPHSASGASNAPRCKSAMHLSRIISALPSSTFQRTGAGIINSLINNIPVELHMPGYEFLGPGTYLDTKLPLSVKPINKLDALARDHDIAYTTNKTVESRKHADDVLIDGAWERVKADDSSLDEKAAAWITTNAMKIKRMIGAGECAAPPRLSTTGGGAYDYSKKIGKDWANGAPPAGYDNASGGMIKRSY